MKKTSRRRPVVSIEVPTSGVFSSSIDGAPLVRKGDHLHQGRVLCLIEADGVVHEIVAPRAGRLAKILVEDGSSVLHGEALFLVELCDDAPGAVPPRARQRAPSAPVAASAGGRSM